MKKAAIILFVIVGVCELMSGFADFGMLHLICKPLILFSLVIYYLTSIDREHRSMAAIVAMIMSLAGDVFLMLQKEYPQFFVFGLASFLIAHVFYIFAYRQHRSESHHPDELQGVQRIRLAFPIILAGSGLVFVLYPTLGDLKIPVLLYAIVLVVMVLTALFRFGRTETKSFWMVFIGAVLFMISDSTLAINKFLMPVAHAELIVMSTYILAQYLIVEGLLNHNPKFRK
jgi:uncharacterized membrane protein YhhN